MACENAEAESKLSGNLPIAFEIVTSAIRAATMQKMTAQLSCHSRECLKTQT